MEIDCLQDRNVARDHLVVRLLILTSVFFATALPNRLPAAEMQVHRNIPYIEPADSSRRLDVYTTDEARDWPIMVWIHGGGWKRGDKTGVQSKPVAFTDHKVVFVSINYRFVPDVTVQEMAGDVAKAVRWVHDHAADIGGDPEKMFLAGHSAGAHLAALVAVDESYLNAEGMSLVDLKGCVAVDTAVYDIAAQLKSGPAILARMHHPVFGDPAEGKNHASINVELGDPDDKPTASLFEFLRSTLAK